MKHLMARVLSFVYRGIFAGRPASCPSFRGGGLLERLQAPSKSVMLTRGMTTAAICAALVMSCLSTVDAHALAGSGRTGVVGARLQVDAGASRGATACVVPLVRGDSLRQARRVLVRAHCRPGSISREKAREGGGQWVVLRESVSPGEQRRSGARVGLLAARIVRRRTVAGGPRTPTHGRLSREPSLTRLAKMSPRRLLIRERMRGLGVAAKDGEKLTVNYVGALYNGKVFDTSWARKEPFTFRLGSGEVIKGWERGLRGMRVGGRRELIIPAREAYGKLGSPPTVPPNATLVFIVDLLGV